MMKTALISLLVAGGAVTAISLATPGYAEKTFDIPAANYTMKEPHGIQTAILAGGCFWSMEDVFDHVKGVKSVTTGYAGGKASTATYSKVSSETTNHAETVKIAYDPSQISYATLLRIYFSVAMNPTEKNRQGPDTGKSYRSAIFPQSAAQKMVAERYIRQLDAAHVYGKPIVTDLESGTFYRAEDYHQNFWRKHPDHPYIVRWDRPKVAALQAMYPKLSKG